MMNNCMSKLSLSKRQDKFIKRHKLPKLAEEEIENLNGLDKLKN